MTEKFRAAATVTQRRYGANANPAHVSNCQWVIVAPKNCDPQTGHDRERPAQMAQAEEDRRPKRVEGDLKGPECHCILHCPPDRLSALRRRRLAGKWTSKPAGRPSSGAPMTGFFRPSYQDPTGNSAPVAAAPNVAARNRKNSQISMRLPFRVSVPLLSLRADPANRCVVCLRLRDGLDRRTAKGDGYRILRVRCCPHHTIDLCSSAVMLRRRFEFGVSGSSSATPPRP